MSDTSLDLSQPGTDGGAQRADSPSEALVEVFLDLEDTIITPANNGWFNTQLMNVQKVRAYLSRVKPDRVSIFSFAIWDEYQRQAFTIGTREMVERVTGPLTLVPTVDDDIIPACKKACNISGDVTFTEMVEFWGKQTAFRYYIAQRVKALRNHDPHVTYIAHLLDDVVHDEDIIWPREKATLIIRNIDTL